MSEGQILPPPAAVPAVMPSLLGGQSDGMPRDFFVLPIETDAMAPTFTWGDCVIVDRTEKRFVCDGLYVVDRLGVPVTYRGQAWSGGIRMFFDNPLYRRDYKSADDVITWEQFHDLLIGRVIAICTVEDPDAMRRISGPPWSA